MMKEETRKEMEQGVLLQGLRELIDSNTENIKSLFQNVKKHEQLNITPQMIPLLLKGPQN